ncbi:hypothetical protein [Rhodococcus sp. WB9]|uniref:hypothetical protein n=1 Tax=Rhodococcus sp. WB9 TaxID=2594007 RepID=UPI0021B341CD|nr:hypothetical protein [Rhodococcus sp. WB9]
MNREPVDGPDRWAERSAQVGVQLDDALDAVAWTAEERLGNFEDAVSSHSGLTPGFVEERRKHPPAVRCSAELTDRGISRLAVRDGIGGRGRSRGRVKSSRR